MGYKNPGNRMRLGIEIRVWAKASAKVRDKIGSKALNKAWDNIWTKATAKINDKVGTKVLQKIKEKLKSSMN